MSEFTGRQLAAVFDLNKCLECHTCTLACKLMWTNRAAANTCTGTTWRPCRGSVIPRVGNGTNQAESGAGQVLGGGFKDVTRKRGQPTGKVRAGAL